MGHEIQIMRNRRKNTKVAFVVLAFAIAAAGCTSTEGRAPTSAAAGSPVMSGELAFSPVYSRIRLVLDKGEEVKLAVKLDIEDIEHSCEYLPLEEITAWKEKVRQRSVRRLQKTVKELFVGYEGFSLVGPPSGDSEDEKSAVPSNKKSAAPITETNAAPAKQANYVLEIAFVRKCSSQKHYSSVEKVQLVDSMYGEVLASHTFEEGVRAP